MATESSPLHRSSPKPPPSSPSTATSTPSATSSPSGRAATAPARPTSEPSRSGQFLVGVAEVKSAHTRPMQAARGTLLEAVITDGRHDLDVTFFKACGHQHALVPGARGIFAGTVGAYGARNQLTHPGYTMLDDFDAGERKDLIPIYLRVGNLHTWTVTESVRRVLDVLDDVPDALPDEVRARRDLVGRTEALRGIHTPSPSTRSRRPGGGCATRRRSSSRRRSPSGGGRRPRRPPVPGPAGPTGCSPPSTSGCRSRSPPASARSGGTLAEEMAREVPMHRLLQGEVGSGKTVVALRAMLAGRRLRRARRPCSPPPRCSPPSTTARSPRCSATSPRAGCSAAPSTAPVSHCSPAASRPRSGARPSSTSSAARPASSSAPTPSSRSTSTSSTSPSSSSTSSTASGSSSATPCAARAPPRRTCS